jgi:hypothetical protein
MKEGNFVKVKKNKDDDVISIVVVATRAEATHLVDGHWSHTNYDYFGVEFAPLDVIGKPG